MLQQPAKPTRLSPERRRALELLLSSPDGINAGLLVFAHGFDQRVDGTREGGICDRGGAKW